MSAIVAAPSIRVLGESDLTAAIALDAAAFGYDPTAEDIERLARPLLLSGELIGAFAGEPDEGAVPRLVGIAAGLPKDLTLPGGRPAPIAAVTWVAVQPGDQRKGVLRALMTHQLHALHAPLGAGTPAIAALTASESGIYGRFGYGMAMSRAELEMPNGLALRPGIRTEPVREVGRDEALPQLREIFEEVRRNRVGYLSRDEISWDVKYLDLPSQRRGGGELRFAVHPDGVLAFRVAMDWGDRGPNHTLKVHELCARTATATASLWHHALKRAMIRTIEYQFHGPDEILQDLLVDPRGAIPVPRDHVWLRIVDLDRAIPLRTYSADVDLSIEIADAVCPWNADTWRLRLSATGDSDASRSAQPAVVRVDIADLAAAFIGGTRIARLAAAGLVSGDATAIDELDSALATRRAPYCPEGF